MSDANNSSAIIERKIIKANDSLKLLDFGVEASNETMSVSEFIDKQKVFRFNDPIQRNSIWNIQKKSLLIVSVIEKVYIGEISVQIIRENKQKFRNVIDGKQRGTTLRDFVKNKFAITAAPYINGLDEEGKEILIDINGLTFDQLPKAFQDRIKAYVFDIKAYEINDNQKQELFYRWNNGEALKPAEKRKARMDLTLLNVIAELRNLPVLQAGLNENDIKRDFNGDSVQQAMAIIATDNDTDLKGSTLDRMVVEGVFTSEIMEATKRAAERLNEAFEMLDVDSRNEAFTRAKTKTTSLLYVVSKLKDADAESLSRFVYDFFTERYVESGFGTYASAGTTKKASVQKRTEILLKYANKWFGGAQEDKIGQVELEV
jgi:hypothetical protein